MESVILFLSSFALVFLMGVQQLNVHSRRYLLSGVTSLLIGLTNLAALKLVPEAALLPALAFLAGGPLGIVTSMWLHDHWLVPRLKEASEAGRD